MKNVFVLFLVLNLAACVGSQPTRYYLLKSNEAPAAAEAEVQGVLGVGPVNLPGYLDHKGIVTGQGEYELRVSDLHQWAEDLDLNVARVLAESLRAQNLGVRIVNYPFTSKEDFSNQLVVDISQFERVAGDQVMLSAAVTIGPRKEENALSTDYQVSTSCQGTAYADTVACMSKTLGQFAEQIAQQIRHSEISDKNK